MFRVRLANSRLGFHVTLQASYAGIPPTCQLLCFFNMSKYLCHAASEPCWMKAVMLPPVHLQGTHWDLMLKTDLCSCLPGDAAHKRSSESRKVSLLKLDQTPDTDQNQISICALRRKNSFCLYLQPTTLEASDCN